MWNNWVEKAKHVAANLDKQINESVGLEDDGLPGTTSLSPAEEENIWNDDFDDQAFNDVDDDKAAPPEGHHTPKPPILEPSEPEPAQTSLSAAAVSTPTVVSLPPPVVPESSPPPASLEVPPEEVPPTNEADVFPNGTTEGWAMEEDNLDRIDNDDAHEKEHEVVDFQEPSAPESDFTATPGATEEMAGNAAYTTASSMLSSFSASAAPMSSLLSSTAKAAGPMSSLLKSAAASMVQNDDQQQLPKDIGTSEAPEATTKSVEAVEEVTAPEAEGWDGDDLEIEDVDSSDVKEEQPVVVSEEPKKETPMDLQQSMVPAATSTPPLPDDDVFASSEPEQPLTASPLPTVETPITLIPSTQTPLNIEEDPRYKKLVEELRLRENQLSSKSEQLTQLQMLWETQERELRQKIQDTKDEAKKRIIRAKERCEEAEAKLQHQSSSTAESGAQSDQLIAALRAEGENLARKQSEMERALRGAKTESRDLREELEGESRAKEQALESIAKLEAELKETKENLSSARKGESQVGKLENDLLAARSDADLKAANIMSLEQQVKELKAEAKELKEGIMTTKKGADQDFEREMKKWRREHNDAIADLELKLRTSEREAGVREDALRHEVSELRKRWQDAVRRADALSMDVQSSTAPLLRQLESMERQNRARAAAWAELETKLRSELEETVIQNETLSKERSEFMTKYNRLERGAKERDAELNECRSTIDSQTAKLKKLEAQLEEMEEEAKKRLEEYTRVERLANEGVARVRSEMTQTVVDSEDRYRGQIEKLEGELRVEKEKRDQLEGQVAQLLDNTGMMMAPQAPHAIRREAKPKKLRETEGQAEILAGALGFDDSDDDDDDDGIGRSQSNDEEDGRSRPGMNSFAALEQLSSRLKIAKVELEALRANLRESEKSRESLLSELSESRVAKEKLPLFEAKVKELAEDNREKELEIEGLRYDIAEVRDLYRTQLNSLLEEKAASAISGAMNGGAAPVNMIPPKQADEESDAVEETPSEMEEDGTAENAPVEAT